MILCADRLSCSFIRLAIQDFIHALLFFSFAAELLFVHQLKSSERLLKVKDLLFLACVIIFIVALGC